MILRAGGVADELPTKLDATADVIDSVAGNAPLLSAIAGAAATIALLRGAQDGAPRLRMTQALDVRAYLAGAEARLEDEAKEVERLVQSQATTAAKRPRDDDDNDNDTDNAAVDIENGTRGAPEAAENTAKPEDGDISMHVDTSSATTPITTTANSDETTESGVPPESDLRKVLEATRLRTKRLRMAVDRRLLAATRALPTPFGLWAASQRKSFAAAIVSQPPRSSTASAASDAGDVTNAGQPDAMWGAVEEDIASRLLVGWEALTAAERGLWWERAAKARAGASSILPPAPLIRRALLHPAGDVGGVPQPPVDPCEWAQSIEDRALQDPVGPGSGVLELEAGDVAAAAASVVTTASSSSDPALVMALRPARMMEEVPVAPLRPRPAFHRALRARAATLAAAGMLTAAEYHAQVDRLWEETEQRKQRSLIQANSRRSLVPRNKKLEELASTRPADSLQVWTAARTAMETVGRTLAAPAAARPSGDAKGSSAESTSTAASRRPMDAELASGVDLLRAPMTAFEVFVAAIRKANRNQPGINIDDSNPPVRLFCFAA